MRPFTIALPSLMDNRLLNLIEAYQVSVAEAIQALESSGVCSRPISRTQWKLNAMPLSGALGASGSYKKHGAGCAVEYNGQSVHFDFGEHGEIDGFDAWRLEQFVTRNARTNPLGSTDALLAEFERAVRDREIIERRAMFYLA